MYPANDPEIIRQQYETDEALTIRQDIHDRYSEPQINFAEWAVDCMDWRGDEKVLDVGSGPGRYYQVLKTHLPDVRYYGSDLLGGMLRNHPATAVGRNTQANAQQLPYASNSFDVVMANHMLFHLPDIDRALREMRRVLKPDGVLIAATNSDQHMPELQFLLRRCITLLTAAGPAQITTPVPPSHLFSLESGTQRLARHFFAVVRHDLPGTFVFTSADPLISYLESSRNLREPQLPRDVAWEAVMLVLRDQIERLTSYGGELRISKLSGVLIASDKGGFIHDYLESLTEYRKANRWPDASSVGDDDEPDLGDTRELKDLRG